MHPRLMQQLVSEHVIDMITAAGDSRRARQACRTRRSGTPRRRTQPEFRPAASHHSLARRQAQP